MTGKSPADLLREEAALIEAGLTMQRQGLDLLFTEMRALAALMPGQSDPTRKPEDVDAEVEAGFDNMPI